MKNTLLISKGNLSKDSLKGKVAIITGAGGGIGFESARSLLWLGAKVVIAEIDSIKGKKAESSLGNEFENSDVLFVKTDIGKARSVRKLARIIDKTFGKVDIIINNATLALMGASHEVGIKKWDRSYRTNLRGPVLLVSQFLPEMLKKNSGTIVFVPSSGAAPYMGAYEVFKTAQVELSNTMAAELEKTGVVTFSIGPGIVKTETAKKAIEEIAPLYEKTVDEFFKMSENALLNVEAAGAGFAASVAMAERYRGLETASVQALIDAGIKVEDDNTGSDLSLSSEELNELEKLFNPVFKTFSEQSKGWMERSVFERQWLLRDFKKNTGASPESFINSMMEFKNKLSEDKLQKNYFENMMLDKISSYYRHQLELLKGYEKNREKVEENTEIINSWIEEIERFLKLFSHIVEKT